MIGHHSLYIQHRKNEQSYQQDQISHRTTNTGKTVGKEGKTLDDATITGKINWYYHNVSLINWK